MITAIAGLESGVIDLNTRINDTGVYTKYAKSGYTPKCWYYSDYRRGHGWLNVSQAIERSCNYFFYETAGSVASPETKAGLHAGANGKIYKYVSKWRK